MKLSDDSYSALYKYTKALSTALSFRDRMTRVHSERVLGIAGEMAVRCGLYNGELGILKIAAAFHDIGKIGIPDNILLKPASFEEDEWRVMRQHPLIGEAIMAAMEIEGAGEAALIIRHHHEHYDGSGYPDKLAGEGIPVEARIIAIADAYDAMAVTRSYHKARTHKKVMEVLRNEAGTKFDPWLMGIFSESIEVSEFKSLTQ